MNRIGGLLTFAIVASTAVAFSDPSTRKRRRRARPQGWVTLETAWVDPDLAGI